MSVEEVPAIENALAHIRGIAREEYDELIGTATTPKIVESAVARAKSYWPLYEAESILVAIVQEEVNKRARTRLADRIRRADIVHDADGVRRDKPFDQLTLFEYEQVALRKIDHGLASEKEGRRDLAVGHAAKEQADALGLTDEQRMTTRICDLLTADEIRRIREAAA